MKLLYSLVAVFLAAVGAVAAEVTDISSLCTTLSSSVTTNIWLVFAGLATLFGLILGIRIALKYIRRFSRV